MNSIKTYHHDTAFLLESGKEIFDLKIAYHTFGKINKSKTNVIWVFHAVSANSNVMDWWPGLFGNDSLFNPESYFIICANVIGSPYGSTAPKDLNFPQFTIRDVAKGHQVLAAYLGINKIHTAIGGSFGGYQALEFTYSFPGTLDHLILLACSAKETAWGIAVHETQRMALQSDPTFGSENGGEAGMKAARSMAMLTYRTSEAFIEQQTDVEEKLDDFRASSYIQYQGDKFVKRFNALSYYYLSKSLDSHNIGRNRGGEVKALNDIKTATLVIGIKSDVLVPTRFQQFLAEHIPNANYEEIESDFGHDGFLVETKKIAEKIAHFYQRNKELSKDSFRKVLKFGGKSMENGTPLQQVLNIVKSEAAVSPIAVIVSARGENTDQLIDLYELAVKGKDYTKELNDFFEYQKKVSDNINFTGLNEELTSVLQAIALLQIKDEFSYDRVVSFGELFSAKTIAHLLKKQGLDAFEVDARKLIFTKLVHDEFEVDMVKSKRETKALFSKLKSKQVPVITGFIASSEEGKTVTLGRNGSNYSATLIASFIGAAEVQNWTDVDGVYSASPKFVSNAVRIEEMSYREANELANFGMNILHPKTILPLMQSAIPLRIKSSLAPKSPGTLINKQGASKGIKAVTVIEDVALVSISGRGLIGNIGIDGRIFSALGKQDISIRLISQASSERGIGFVINKTDARRCERLLNKEFEEELRLHSISNISVNNDVGIIAIVGRHNYALEKAIRGLRKNKIWMHLISNSISGEHISLVIDSKKTRKAVRVVHNEVFGVVKRLHLFAFGKGNVGGTLLDQIIETPKERILERGLEIKIIGVADSTGYIFDSEGLGKDWRTLLKKEKSPGGINQVLPMLVESGIENIVIADNTSSLPLTKRYIDIVNNGFDIVASNKKANSIDYSFYANLRKALRNRGRSFYYETNVGAGLPIIDTIKHLRQSSDQITKIRGVFSGSLSYLFNHFSIENESFSTILIQAKEKGLTEPDPREDLSGMDVARKLIILAREVGLSTEYEEVSIENLIPESMRKLSSFSNFLEQSALLDKHYTSVKNKLENKEVLRYLGELEVATGKLKVSLVKVDVSTPLGNIRGADSIFEIYTEGYGTQPIIVQGAGAGAGVTARGVYSDLLRLGHGE